MLDSWSPPTPMLAALGDPPDGEGWAFEMKWDGQRAIAMTRGGQCRLFSRNGRDITGTFPELPDAVLAALGGRNAVVDGEIVSLDAKGRPSFSRLQQRMHVQRPTRQLRDNAPVVYYLFDVLDVDDEPTTALTYLERRSVLDTLVHNHFQVQVPPHWTETDGRTLLGIARNHGLEGIVAKRTSSVYLPGRRSPTWTKTPLRAGTEAIVVGWLPGSGSASGGIGSLILAAHDDDRNLVYIGNVGTGFTTAMRRELRTRLRTLELATSPLDPAPPSRETRGAHWAEPILVGDVEYRDYSSGRLRHPSWKGLRDDKMPGDVDLPGRH